VPADDKIHAAVKNALIKDGWIITPDPYRIEHKEAKLYADLRADSPFTAERNGEIIVVEIKSLLSPFSNWACNLPIIATEQRRGGRPRCSLFRRIKSAKGCVSRRIFAIRKGAF
jgi:hypothetical protein